MFGSGVMRVHKRVVTPDDSGGGVVTHVPDPSVAAEAEDVRWRGVKVFSRDGLAMRRPVGVMSEFDVMVTGPLPDASVWTVEMGDLLQVEEPTVNAGQRLAIVGVEVIGILGASGVRVRCKVV